MDNIQSPDYTIIIHHFAIKLAVRLLHRFSFDLWSTAFNFIYLFFDVSVTVFYFKRFFHCLCSATGAWCTHRNQQIERDFFLRRRRRRFRTASGARFKQKKNNNFFFLLLIRRHFKHYVMHLSMYCAIVWLKWNETKIWCAGVRALACSCVWVCAAHPIRSVYVCVLCFFFL